MNLQLWMLEWMLLTNCKSVAALSSTLSMQETLRLVSSRQTLEQAGEHPAAGSRLK
jgi:hypothetical protein